jgi:DNA-directed RNA polymerase specialized sigma subunit
MNRTVERRLVSQAKSGNADALNRLLLANEASIRFLVGYTVAEVKGLRAGSDAAREIRDADREDQGAALLVRLADYICREYDEDKGARVWTAAKKCLNGVLRDMQKTGMDEPAPLTEEEHSVASDVRTTWRELRGKARLGREPTDAEIADEVGTDEETVHNILERHHWNLARDRKRVSDGLLELRHELGHDPTAGEIAARAGMQKNRVVEILDLPKFVQPPPNPEADEDAEELEAPEYFAAKGRALAPTGDRSTLPNVLDFAVHFFQHDRQSLADVLRHHRQGLNDTQIGELTSVPRHTISVQKNRALAWVLVLHRALCRFGEPSPEEACECLNRSIPDPASRDYALSPEEACERLNRWIYDPASRDYDYRFVRVFRTQCHTRPFSPEEIDEIRKRFRGLVRTGES